MNSVQRKVRGKKIQERNLELRNQFWPDLNKDMLWHRKRNPGFISIPRTLPYIMQIMDEMSNGKPVSATYFALWCHTFDESFVRNDKSVEMSFESGFRGQRAETTWKNRMKILQELGFIEVKSGPSGPCNYVVILNPHKVVKQHVDSGKYPETDTYRALLDRVLFVGDSL